MGLAPYGEPRYARLILDHLIDIKPDGSFRLNLDYFDYCTGLTMTNEQASTRCSAGRRASPRSALTQRDMDLAASIQAVTEEVMLRLARAIATETGETNLCLAGGVALNCVANGKLLRDGAFERIWIQPAAGDAGGALGAALRRLPPVQHGSRARSRNGDRRDARRLSSGRIRAGRHRARLRGGGRALRRSLRRRRAADRGARRALADGKARRLVPGPHGVRPARARCALDPRRCALADDAEDAEPEVKFREIVPAVRARRCCARTWPTGSSSTATARTCCSSPTWSRHRGAMTPSSRRCSASTS